MYNNLWSMWSLRICETSVQALLASGVSIKKTGVILIALCLYANWYFSFEALIFFVFYTFSALIINFKRYFFSGIVYLVFNMLPVHS